MRGEFELIDRYFAPLARAAAGADGLRNDAALFDPAPGHSLVVTVDAMVEGVHFLPDDPAALVGRKLLRVNLSDLAAMGARPRGYLLAAAWSGRIDEDWIAAFADGLAVDQDLFDVALYGGDTVSTPGPLTLSLTAFGEVARGAALTRAGARAGDLIYVSGTIGDGALGLRSLSGELPGLAAADAEALAARYRLPEPRVALGRALAEGGIASAAMDISDGLVADLGHIAKSSGLGATLRAADVPLGAAAARALTGDANLGTAILTGGDDYELLFTVDPGRAGEVAALAGSLDLALTSIGAMEAGANVRVLDAAGAPLDVPRGGWRHF